MMAMCAAGPPKAVVPRRKKKMASSRSEAFGVLASQQRRTGLWRRQTRLRAARDPDERASKDQTPAPTMRRKSRAINME